MKFFSVKKNIFPVFALALSVYIMVFGLITARKTECSYFLIGVFLWLALFGCWRSCLKILPVYLVVGGIFAVISYFTSDKNLSSAIAMANRLAAVFVAVIPGMSVKPVSLYRNLSQWKAPRSVTLGMLIASSFVPVLKAEIRRVREAMKTRGAGSVLNPKILYRAFLIPFISRLVDISDTLALSVETRGFTLEKVKYTVYKREYIGLFDFLFLLVPVACSVLVVLL